MAWTPPRTWVNGETPDGATFNTHVRDNLAYLKDSPTFDGNVTVSDVTVGDDLGVNGDASVVGGLTVGALGVTGNALVGGNFQCNGDMLNVRLVTYTETRAPNVVITGGIATIDCALGTYFNVSLNANCTMAVVNPPAMGRALGVTLTFIPDGTPRTVIWPGVLWPGGLAPTMTATAGKYDVITLLYTGSGWLGVIVGQAY